MITVLGTPISPLESYTNAVFTVASNNPLCKKMTGTFLGTGFQGAQALQTQAQISVGTTANFTFDLQEFYCDNLYYNIQTPAEPTAGLTAGASVFRLAGANFQELLSVNGQLVAGDSYLLTQDFFVVNAARQTYNEAGLPNRVIDPAVLGFEKFLTDIPEIKIRRNESFVLSAYTDSAINRLSYNFRNASGTSLSSGFIVLANSGRIDIPVGLANLAAAGVSVPNGAVDYVISIGVFSGTFARQSEFMTFTIVDNCLDNPLRVHFLNRWGGFDSFTFRDYKRITSTSTSLYEKYLSNGFTARDRGRQAQYRETTPQLRATSDPLSREERLWLEELVGTAVAYIEQDGRLIPVTVNDREYVSIDEQSIGVLSITLTLANSIRNQRL